MMTIVVMLFIFLFALAIVLACTAITTEVLFWAENNQVHAKISSKLFNVKPIKQCVLLDVRQATLMRNDDTDSDKISYAVTIESGQHEPVSLYTVYYDNLSNNNFDNHINLLNEKITLARTTKTDQYFVKPYELMAVIFGVAFLLVLLIAGIVGVLQN